MPLSLFLRLPLVPCTPLRHLFHLRQQSFYPPPCAGRLERDKVGKEKEWGKRMAEAGTPCRRAMHRSLLTSGGGFSPAREKSDRSACLPPPESKLPCHYSACGCSVFLCCCLGVLSSAGRALRLTIAYLPLSRTRRHLR
ncbi:hypothetical protein MRX96_046914 [Rhipicephalus microplus]